jgi:mRNA interferase MazF
VTAPQFAEVWDVRLDPTRGDEMKKCRPCLVITPPGIGRLKLSTIVPFTEWDASYKRVEWLIHVEYNAVYGLTEYQHGSAADCFQVKSLSHDRFITKLGEMTHAPQLPAIRLMVGQCLGLMASK